MDNILDLARHNKHASQGKSITIVLIYLANNVLQILFLVLTVSDIKKLEVKNKYRIDM
jgi:hypothetical protein